jgi:ADP-heptose:LPS heptosyltransferase
VSDVDPLHRLPESDPIAARPWREASPPARALAIRLHALGDTVITLPYLSALRRAQPALQLDFLTRVEVADIPRDLVLFDRVHEIAGGRDPARQLLHALALVPTLARRRYDVVLDLQRNRISRLVRRLLRPRAWAEFDRFSPQLAGERTRLTIEAAGFGPLEVAPDLVLRDPDVGERALRAHGWDGASDLVVLNPAGGFSGRRWPAASYARFAELWMRAAAAPVTFVVLGLPATAARARAIAAHLRAHLLDLVGRTTVTEAFAIVRRATLVVSEDSGLMHMAWVAGAPTLALFGASRAAWARPHGTHADLVAACRLRDGACLGGACRAGGAACIETIAAEEVCARGRALVERLDQTPRVIYARGTAYAPALGA